MSELEEIDTEFVTPKSLDELLLFLDEHKGETTIVAGGTDLYLLVKREVIRPRYLIDITGIHELHYIKEDAEYVRIGASMTLTEIEKNEIVNRYFPVLVDAVKTMAARQIRNVATLAGNLANASPAADSAPPLIVLGAKVILQSKNNEREVPVEDLFVFVKKTIIESNEIIKEIKIPKPPEAFAASFEKLGKRNALVLAIVSAAASVVREGDVIKDVRIALGSVAPTPLRVKKAEDVLKGKTPTTELIEKAAEVVMNEVKPISDVRASAEYRKDMARVLSRRVLLNTLKKLGWM
ncbi:MAG: xanthine dehydrogenase family protein subunit M [Candidatus Odinarchaeota archaeon]|nr:xanthine dehydrogenase family protein subunit M [Candidatus Odinarchaeota archaeon]